MDSKFILFGLACLLVATSQVQATCKSNNDCSASQCCGYSNNFLNILKRDVTRTCVSLSGEGGQCPASGVGSLMHVCGCQSGLVCFTAPSGMVPMYGRCITQAQYKIEQERIKNNPWLNMLPSANLG